MSVDSPYEWKEGEWSLTGFQALPEPKFHVVAYDFGVKRNILRMLAQRGCRVTVVPAQTPAADVLAMTPDGIFCRTAPATPSPAITRSPRSASSWPAASRPSASASATSCWRWPRGQDVKMKFGHHGANHPVRISIPGRC